jgi:mRNA-degrading endonuclease RelE of RelBE toxin-antitoxin system
LRVEAVRPRPGNPRLAATAHLTIAPSGYSLARMPFEIVLSPEAVEDFRSMRANVQAEIRAALGTHLRHEPEKVSRSRIKRLRALRQPQYRLRVGEVRIFYDVIGDTVEILAIVMKRDADAWLAQFGNPE